MVNWLSKNRILLGVGLIFLAIILYVLTVSSPLPDPSISRDDLFFCTDWDSATFSFGAADSFVISSNGIDYEYFSFEPNNRRFSCNGNTCEGPDFTSDIIRYGALQNAEDDGPFVVLASESNVIYSCYPAPVV